MKIEFNNLEHIQYFGLLIFLGIVCLISYIYKKNKQLKSFSKAQAAIVYPISLLKIKYKVFLFIIGITLCFVSLMDPFVYQETKKFEKLTSNIIICLDISKSMLAEDVRPNRLEKAKQEIISIIRRLPESKIGLIVFTSEALTLSPLTLDHTMLFTLVNEISVNIFAKQGSKIGIGLSTALEIINNDPSVSILLVTDGEDQERSYKNALKNIENSSIKIYTIGIGTERGAPIPIYTNNNKSSSFHTDKNGNPVVTKLNSDILNEISERTNAKYFSINSNSFSPDFFSKSIHDDSNDVTAPEKVYIYKYFLFPALLLILLGFILNSNLNHIFVIALLSSSLSFPRAFNYKQYLNTKKGNEYFYNDNFPKSKEYYYKALAKEPMNETIRYNLGNIYANNNEPEKALQEWSAVSSPKNLSDVYFNQSILNYRQGNYKETKDNLIQSLSVNPNDVEAKKNLEAVIALLKEEKKDQNSQKDQQENNEEKSDDQTEQNNFNEQNEQKEYTEEEAKDIIKSLSKTRMFNPENKNDEEREENYDW